MEITANQLEEAAKLVLCNIKNTCAKEGIDFMSVVDKALKNNMSDEELHKALKRLEDEIGATMRHKSVE